MRTGMMRVCVGQEERGHTRLKRFPVYGKIESGLFYTGKNINMKIFC